MDDVLFSRKTLATTVLDQKYADILQTVRNELKLNINNGIAFTTDFWTDDQLQISYMSLTGHCINENYNLKSYMLKTINFDEKKTGDNIKLALWEIISDIYQFTKKELLECRDKNLYCFVTDNGAALKDDLRLSCAGLNNINLVIEFLFKNVDENGELQNLTRNCKSLVTYFKRSGLNNKLDTSLKQSVPTRWNSVFYMFQSVQKSFDECTALLVERKELTKMGHIDINLLNLLVSLLEPFEKATRELSKEKEPTICYVFPWFEKLKKHINTFDCDNNVTIDECVAILKTGLNDKYVVKDFHKIATVFDPRIRTLKNLCSENEKVRLHKLIIKDTKASFLKDDRELVDNINKFVEEPEPKKQKFSDLEEYFECSPSTSTSENVTLEEELSLYINSKSITTDTDPLTFWRNNKDTYKNLSQYAKYILSVPATSTPSERIFSITGKTLEKRRSTLSPTKVDKLLFLHYNDNF